MTVNTAALGNFKEGVMLNGTDIFEIEFEVIGEGMYSISIDDLKIRDYRNNPLFIGTESTSINGRIGNSGESALQSFSLMNNYPNPFNAATTVSYALDKPGNVEIVIYNTLGQMVKTLVHETGSTGHFSVVWDGTNDSDFQVNGGVIIADTSNPTAGVACGTIEAVILGSDQIRVTVRSSLSTSADLIAVPAHEYRVAGTQLLWNGNALTDGVEDLQVTYIIENDTPPNNQVDAANEIFGDDESSAHQLFNQSNPNGGSGSVTLTGSAAELVREIEVSIVVRTRLEDEDFNMGRFQGTGNRDVSGVTADGFRRRVITTKVMLRNVAMQI